MPVKKKEALGDEKTPLSSVYCLLPPCSYTLFNVFNIYFRQQQQQQHTTNSFRSRYFFFFWTKNMFYFRTQKTYTRRLTTQQQQQQQQPQQQQPQQHVQASDEQLYPKPLTFSNGDYFFYETKIVGLLICQDSIFNTKQLALPPPSFTTFSKKTQY